MESSRHQRRKAGQRTGVREGFTLIELLVVVSIIALLVGILVPSLSGARDSAKRATTQADLKTIATGLTLFNNDNEKEYPRTNGYPESAKADDPASVGTQEIYGAHWLVRSLVGKDFAGFIPRRIVPRALQDRSDDTGEQVRWYDPQTGDPPIDRIPPYVPLDRLKTVITEDLVGLPPPSPTFPLPSNPLTAPSVRHAPVFVDPWGGPILYYAANSFGNAVVALGTPGIARLYFDHEDNELFTGSDLNSIDSWLFQGARPHLIRTVGTADPSSIDDMPTWARYIHNERLHEQNPAAYVKPLPRNLSTYLLIAPGPDRQFGTNDDVNNFGK